MASQKSKAFPLFIATCLSSLPSGTLAEGRDKLTALTDPHIRQEMVSNSGFMVDLRQFPDLIFENGQSGLGIIGIPIGGGKYQIVGRFAVPPEHVDGKSPISGTELMANDGTCVTYQHNDPAKRLDVGETFDPNLYEPVKVCSYQINLSDDQVRQLAYGQARVNQFFASISVNDAIPAVGGREITDPIGVDTYNLDPAVNKALWLNTAKVWLACWDASDMSLSGDISGFDHPSLSKPQETDKCETAKAAAQSAMGDVRVGVSGALADAAEADRDEAARKNRFISDILQDLRG